MLPEPAQPVAASGRLKRPSLLLRGLGWVLVVAAAVGGLMFVPPVVMGVGPTAVSARAELGHAETVVRVPAIGTVSAGTHSIPLRLQVDIDEVDVERLADLATSTTGRAELREAIEQDLGILARRIAVRTLSGAAALGVITTLVLFQRRWRRALAGAAVGGMGALLVLAGTAVDYRLEAFDDPTFNGPISRARAVIDAVGERVQLLDEARSRYEIAARRMSDLMVVLGAPARDPRQLDTVILHVSDIHANPLAFDFISQLVAEFDADAVVDTGDISSSVLDTGGLSSLSGPIDELMTREIERLRVPYLFVSGNHDAPGTLRRLAALDNVELLDGSSTAVDSVDIFGWADPTYSTAPIPEDAKREDRAAEAPRVAEGLQGTTADVLAVHDSILSRDAFGEVGVVVAGHTHEGSIEEIDGSRILTVGSTGATGLKSLTLETDKTYDAQLLYFDDDDLVAVDYVRLQNLNGDFTLERRTF
ncbi:MAG: metallophosphoesterase [Actinomycetota bacterium]